MVVVGFQIGGCDHFSNQWWLWIFKSKVVVGFQTGSGVNAVFGCVDGGGWVAVSVLVGLIWVWAVVVLLMEGTVVVADVCRFLL